MLAGSLADQDEAWRYYIWCEALDWKHLPAVGGLEDQDELLMENMFLIKQMVQKIRMNNRTG